MPDTVQRDVQMKWMATTLHVKGLNEGERTIMGIATTPSIDHVGDIVESMGAKYKLPIPLLWMHRHDQPVGTVTYAEPNEKGIPFQARIAKVEEPGKLKDRVDEAWQSIKAGLVKGVSIGFSPIKDGYELIKETGGVRFKNWTWHELSLVVIPAQADAQIQLIRSLDAEALRAAAAGDPLPSVHVAEPTVSPPPPKVVVKQDAIVEWINDFSKTKEWMRVLEERKGHRPTSDAALAKYAAANVRLRQPKGAITQDQIQFEAWELRRFW